jgi:cyclase
MTDIKKRIVPVFTYKSNVLVKSINYENYRNVNSILPIIKLFNKRNIDEMIFLNLDNNINLNLLENFVNETDYPITYGGGIDNIDTMRKIYSIGFDKICLNSILYKDNDF